jgi:hypothetical protein
MSHPTGKPMRLVLKGLKAAFSVLALAALLGAAIGLGAEVIHWLETGTWTGAQHMALWVVAQSLTLVYAAFAVVCLLLWFVVV